MRFRLILFLIAALFSLSYGDEYSDLMGQGQKQYRNGNYKESAENFKQAEVLKPDDPLATYNNAAALYKGRDYLKASEKYSQAAAKASGEMKEDSYYNLGNACFKSQDYTGAMNAYKETLMINPKNNNAKINYELAKSRQQQQQQQQKQDDKKNDQNKDQDKQKQQEDKNQDQQKQNQDQQKEQQDNNQDPQKQNQNQQKEQQDKQKQNEQQQQQEEQKNQDKQQQQNAQTKPGEMTKQEAKELLGAFKADEKQVQEQLRKIKVQPGSGRDW